MAFDRARRTPAAERKQRSEEEKHAEFQRRLEAFRKGQ